MRSRLETISALTAIALLVTGLMFAASPHRYSQPELVSVKVHSGESLWSVAERYPVDGLSTAETVQLIAEANSLKGSLVQAESTLKVPAAAESTNLADNRSTISTRQ